MRIEEGKFYRTRDGQKALVIGRGSSPTTTRLSIDGSETICFTDTGRGGYPGGTDYGTDIVALWADEPAGPVRTVTRKEIVEGEYGRVRVLPLAGASDRHVGVRFISGEPIASLTAPELRAAAATLIELADALEDGK